MRLIYIAGSYTARHAYQVKRNIIKADLLGIELCLLEKDLFPVIPHANTSHYEGCRGDHFFIDGTKELMRRCDGVLVVPGWENSSGTKGEIAEAEKQGIPVFYSLDELNKYVW